MRGEGSSLPFIEWIKIPGSVRPCLKSWFSMGFITTVFISKHSVRFGSSCCLEDKVISRTDETERENPSANRTVNWFYWNSVFNELSTFNFMWKVWDLCKCPFMLGEGSVLFWGAVFAEDLSWFFIEMLCIEIHRVHMDIIFITDPRNHDLFYFCSSYKKMTEKFL